MQTRYFKPEEIVDAINEAKKRNPKDLLGEGAFRLKTDGARANKDGTVTYLAWEMNVAGPNGDRIFVPVKITSRGVNTHSNIKLDAGKPGVQLQFRRSSEGTWTNPDKSVVKSPLGEAIFLMSQIFPVIVKKKLEKGDLQSDNQKVSIPVQIAPKDPKTKKLDMSKKFDDPIIRIKIDFPRNESKGIDLTAEPTCKIYDLEKPRPKNQCKQGEPALFLAEYRKNPDAPPEKVMYGNMPEVIRYGSSITSVIDFSAPTVSGMGISMSPKFEIIMVKRAVGREINVFDAFGDQLDDISEVSKVVEETVAPKNEGKDDKVGNASNLSPDDLDGLEATPDDLILE